MHSLARLIISLQSPKLYTSPTLLEKDSLKNIGLSSSALFSSKQC
jgi:hypothetical protein